MDVGEIIYKTLNCRGFLQNPAERPGRDLTDFPAFGVNWNTAGHGYLRPEKNPVLDRP